MSTLNKIITILLLIATISVGIFTAFALVSHAGGHGDCLMAQMTGDCSEISLSMLFLHIDFLKSFSLAILVFTFITLIILAIQSFGVLPKTNISKTSLRVFDFQKDPHAARFLYWLSLHENSPNA